MDCCPRKLPLTISKIDRQIHKKVKRIVQILSNVRQIGKNLNL